MSYWSREKKTIHQNGSQSFAHKCLDKMLRDHPKGFIPTSLRVSCTYTHLPVCCPHLSGPCSSHWTLSGVGDRNLTSVFHSISQSSVSKRRTSQYALREELMKPRKLDCSVRNVSLSCKSEKLVPVVEQGREQETHGDRSHGPFSTSLT